MRDDEVRITMKYIDAATAAEIISNKLNIPLSNLCDILAEIPSEDVQPVKHGKWIFQNRNDEDGRYIYHCSECDFEVRVFPCNLVPWQMHEKYCPGCGARMDGDSE
jgi:hypothetical protein